MPITGGHAHKQAVAVATSLDQAHRDTRIFTQASGERATCRAGAGDNIVVGLVLAHGRESRMYPCLELGGIIATVLLLNTNNYEA